MPGTGKVTLHIGNEAIEKLAEIKRILAGKVPEILRANVKICTVAFLKEPVCKAIDDYLRELKGDSGEPMGSGSHKRF